MPICVKLDEKKKKTKGLIEREEGGEVPHLVNEPKGGRVGGWMGE